MKKRVLATILFSVLLAACGAISATPNETVSPRFAAAANIVDAVNNKSAEQYAQDLHPDVTVKMYDGDVRIRGRDALIDNRRSHFIANPGAKNELVHLVEIDDRVVMHDLVWLDGNTNNEPANIVEIFHFSGDQIVQIDVIQPENLFSR